MSLSLEDGNPAGHRTGWYLVLILHYLVVSAILMKFYQHEIDADGISYLSLAQKYLDGDFKGAVNGYWSPLISWLLVPLLYFNMEPTTAFRIASLCIGLASLLGIGILLEEIKVLPRVKILYLLSLAPVIAWYAQNDVGADLLGACVLTYYLYQLSTCGRKIQSLSGIKAGILGAIAYLAKNYNLYFFVLHFTSVGICCTASAENRNKKRIILTRFICGIIVFGMLCGGWIFLLSSKYHKLTVATGGSVNLSLVRPGSLGPPMLTDGFLPPPNATAVSVCEDPTYMRFPAWNPFASPGDFTFYLHLVLNNVRRYVTGLATNYIFVVTSVVLLYKFFCLREVFERKIYLLIYTLLLYPVGYFALYYEGQRYVLINVIILYVLSAYLLTDLLSKHVLKQIQTWAIFISLYSSLLGLTAYRMYKDIDHVNSVNQVYQLSKTLSCRCKMNGCNIASEHENWNLMFDLAFYLKSRYFGEAKSGISDQELTKELLANKIDYFLVAGNMKHKIKILEPVPRFDHQPYDLTIYKVHRS